jgi:hypothetical protein
LRMYDSIGCDTQMPSPEGESIGRWCRRYFGVGRRDGGLHTSVSINASDSARIPSRSTSRD